MHADPFAFRLRLTLLDGTTTLSQLLSGDEQYRDRLVREVLRYDAVEQVDILELHPPERAA